LADTESVSGFVLGIDLGTVNSCVAAVKDGKAVILGSGSDRTIPSWVAFQDETHTVGHAARRQQVTDPFNTVSAVKRLLGHAYASPEVQTALERAPYEINEGPDGGVLLELGGRSLTPIEISTLILERIKTVAEGALGEPVHEAVISVPAHFTDVQRKATKLAAEAAGLEVLRLINEPTAAAFAYGYRRGEDCALAIYDLGGGTFDVTVMHAVGDSFEVIATDGDSYLGGEDFDHAVERWLAKEFDAEFGHDLRGDSAALVRIREAAESAKIELSSAEESTIELPFLAQVADGSRPDFTRVLSREKLIELTKPLADRTLDLCKRCLEEANVQVAEIDDVLLVGGQSRMPVVREAVREFFGREPRRDINPDEVVAMGAALYGYSLRADDLCDAAVDSAEEAFEVALKTTEVARKLLNELKLASATESRGDHQLKSRLSDLLADTGEEQSNEPRSALEQAKSTVEEIERQIASTEERAGISIEDLPDRHNSGERDLPQALDQIHSDLNEMRDEAKEVLYALLDEVVSEECSDTEDGGPDTRLEAAEQLSKMLDDAQQASGEVADGLNEAAAHASARRVELVDVTSHALGVGSAGDLFASLIKQNTRIPAEYRRTFTTNQDGQREVNLSVLQGRSSRASENQLLGNFVLEGIAPAERMQPRIEVCFTIDADGILSVSASDQQSGAVQSIRIEDPLGLQQASAKDLQEEEDA
jgi:molecular chaperone DnaK